MPQRYGDEELYLLMGEKIALGALARMSRAELIAQLEIWWNKEFDDDPYVPIIEDVALAIRNVVENRIREYAEERFNVTPELEPYKNIAFYDWGTDMREHYDWLCTARTSEIVTWAQGIAEDEEDDAQWT